jgi:hypothetical protein
VTREAEHFLRVSSSRPGRCLRRCSAQCWSPSPGGDLLGVNQASLFRSTRRPASCGRRRRGCRESFFQIRVPGARHRRHRRALRRAGVAVGRHTDSRFDSSADRASGYRTKSVLCVPIHDLGGRVFAVAQALNKRSGEPFDAADLRRFQEWMAALGVLLESWWRMSERGTRGGPG